nr:hypothetical protein [Atlantibacter hermannii]
MHGFACVYAPFLPLPAPVTARPEPVHAPALKPPPEAGRRGGESIARNPGSLFMISINNPFDALK